VWCAVWCGADKRPLYFYTEGAPCAIFVRAPASCYPHAGSRGHYIHTAEVPLLLLLERRQRKPRFALRSTSSATQGGVPSHPTAAVMSSRKPRALNASDTTRSAASSTVAHSRTYPATFK
jgi:hypothetical protein